MQNSSPFRPARGYGSIAELRGAIDALDAHLVGLLALHQTYIERAAELKPARHSIRDPERIEDVVVKMIAAGRKAGPSPAIAEPVWRTLIESSIRHEFKAFDRRTS